MESLLALPLSALAGLAQDVPPIATPPEIRKLRIGETISGVLGIADPPLAGRGPSQRFQLDLGEGPVTIQLGSHDFDACLRVESALDGSFLEDDDSGIETDARLVLAKPAGSFTLIACSKAGDGEFALSIEAGEVPLPAGAALADAAITWRGAAAERAIARNDKKAAARHRLEEGNQLYARSQFREARTAYESSLSLVRELGNRKWEAIVLGNLGNVHLSLGDYPRAREHYEQHAALAREVGDRAGEARALGNLGVVYYSIGDFPRARETYEQHLTLARELGDRAGESRSLGNLGSVHHSLGDYARAQELHEQCLALARELGDRALEAAALIDLGNNDRSQGDYRRARDHCEEGLAVARQVGHRQWEANALSNLGAVHRALGDFARALEFHAQHLALARELGDRAGEGRALGNLGDVYDSLGDYPRAREYHAQHLARARELGNRAEEAIALGSLGGVHDSLGDLSRARELHAEHLALARELGDRGGEARALGNLGKVCGSLGDDARAREHYEQALIILRALGSRSMEAWALGNLGNVYRSLEDYPRARECYEQAIAIARELGNREIQAASLGNLAVVDLLLGDPARARELARTAEAQARELGTRESTIYRLRTVARASLSLLDSEGAHEALTEAERMLGELSAAELDQRETTGLRGRFAGLGETAQDLVALRLTEAGQDAVARAAALRSGFAAAGRWKGRALLEGIAEHRSGARSAGAIEIRRSQREALAAHAVILARVSNAIRDEKPHEEVETLRSEAAAKLAEIHQLSKRLREISPQDAELDLPLGVSPEDVRRAVLGPRELLVEYAEGEKRLYAYVLGEESLELLDLGVRAEIATALEKFLDGIRAPGRLQSPAEVGRTGHALFARLLAPALDAAKGPIERLVIVPCASLAALPFEALVCDGGNGAAASFGHLPFVLDRYEVTYGPSAPVLIEIAGTPARRAPGKLLLLADPRYASEDEAQPDGVPVLAAAAHSRARPEARDLPRLPGTRDEALAIASLVEVGSETDLAELRARRSGSHAGERLELHLGSAASRARLAGDLRGYSALHLACHGFVDAEFPQRTGLALAGTQADEGWFTIGDTLELDLDADLVALSACQTAQGEARAGEGVESLARAFLHAGARGLVASVWPVDDRAAAQTMTAFYRGWLRDGHPPARALREAKLDLRHGRLALGPARGVGVSAAGATPPSTLESGHPFFWAPFLHIGLGGKRIREPQAEKR